MEKRQSEIGAGEKDQNLNNSYQIQSYLLSENSTSI